MSKPEDTNVTPMTKIDVTTIGKLEAAFQNDYTIESACRYAAISRMTYYRYLKNPEFAEKMSAAQNKLLDIAGEIINQYMGDKSIPITEKVKIAVKFKERRDGRYKSTVAVEVDPTKRTLEDKMKDFLDDEATRPNNLPDNSEEATTEDTEKA